MCCAKAEPRPHSIPLHEQTRSPGQAMNPEGGRLKDSGKVVQILEAFDLCGSYRAAGELAGCSHNTAARYVELREGGGRPEVGRRRKRLIDPHLEKGEEWVGRSRGRVRCDVCHRKLLAMGYGGSERSTRRAVAEAKGA